jgi:cobalt-zinc-cadmium efflux system membrane fusion protein
MFIRAFVALGLFCSVGFVGCAPKASPYSVPAPSKVSSIAEDHSGWWCAEHGVPEEVCGLCDSKVGAEMKKKGDWCKIHDCPDSQCFVCHPEYEAKFVALHQAKLGTKPPKRE